MLLGFPLSIYACSVTVKDASQRGPAILGWLLIVASIGWMVWQVFATTPPPP